MTTMTKGLRQVKTKMATTRTTKAAANQMSPEPKPVGRAGRDSPLCPDSSALSWAPESEP